MSFLSSVWYTRCPAPTPLSIAHQLGWIDRQFESSGVIVRSIRDSKDPVVRQSHFTHALDYSFRQGATSRRSGRVPADARPASSASPAPMSSRRSSRSPHPA